ncbi:MAG: hypothetical protein ACAH35_01150 [Candidatus Paceibacterota bacterium]
MYTPGTHRLTVELPRVLGSLRVVETQEGDEIFYAWRVGREWPSRFVRNKQAVPTRQITLILKVANNLEHANLLDCYLGPHAPAEPESKRRTSESEEFWRNHAFVWDPEGIKEGSEIPEAAYLASRSER